MKNIFIIIKKQLMDTFKNKTILIQFILFPLMTLIMENAVQMDNMPELFFTKLFSVMYIGMAPLTSVAAIISEEKEKNTLRVLMMANVKPWQYILGVGIYDWIICMIGACVMSVGFDSSEILIYLIIMAVGFIISITAGACVGIFAVNQMSATSLVMPLMLVLSFAPMLAMFNDKIAKVAKIFYTQQLRSVLDEMSFDGIGFGNVGIVLANAVLFVILFGFAFRSKGLE